MSKLHIIKTIDEVLFDDLRKRTKELYEEAKHKYNHDMPFTYKMYTGAGFTRYPTPDTVRFLDSFESEIQPVTDMRRRITAWVTQFLNLCTDERAIIQLLPESLSDQIWLRHLFTPCESDLALIEDFKQRPEYKLIKRRLVILTL